MNGYFIVSDERPVTGKLGRSVISFFTGRFSLKILMSLILERGLTHALANKSEPCVSANRMII